MNTEIPVLLSATVNPNGMIGASFSVEERARMYAEALSFYATKGVKVVFAENSGSISAVQSLVLFRERIEWVDVSGSEYDQSRGKGYNETLLIKKAIAKSQLIRSAGCFFKITGRLKLQNVLGILAECESHRVLHFMADCKDHNVYQWLHMPINGHSGECRYWFATVDFFEQHMFPKLDKLCDYGPDAYLAEDAMLEVCREFRGKEGCFDRFRLQARISGKGGHALGKGLSFFYSTDNDSWALRIKSGLRQLLRYIAPFWRC